MGFDPIGRYSTHHILGLPDSLAGQATGTEGESAAGGQMMFDFFHGWRRKAGCVLLVMAFAFTILWMRSMVVHDVVRLGEYNDCHYWVTSDDGELYVGMAAHKRGATHIDTVASIRHWHIDGALGLLSAILILWPGKRPERKAKAPLVGGWREHILTSQHTSLFTDAHSSRGAQL